MPALLEVRLCLDTPERPTGWLGVPLHGVLFDLLAGYSSSLASRIHEASVKPFRVGAISWLPTHNEYGECVSDVTELRFQLGVLDDSLLEQVTEMLAAGRTFGEQESSLAGETGGCRLLRQSTYADLYTYHAAETGGRTIRMQLLSPTTFRTEIDMPFPVPRMAFYGLQRCWEAYSDLHFGELGEWVGRAVRVRDYALRPRTVHFKGLRGAALMASVGEVVYEIARPGDVEPRFVRLLADYANFAGLGYKTAYGLGHVKAAGWRVLGECAESEQSSGAEQNLSRAERSDGFGLPFQDFTEEKREEEF